MAKFLNFKLERFDKLDAYMHSMEKIEGHLTGIIKCGVYDGAAIATQAVKDAIRDVTSYEATGSLEKSVMLAKMEEDMGYIFTKIVYNGYDENGVPQVLKARVLENGRSDQEHRVPTHFCSKAIRKYKKKIEDAMDDTINERCERILREIAKGEYFGR